MHKYHVEMIELQRASFEYDLDGVRHHAVTDLDLSISTGEFVAVLGENGSGKTTFTRMLNGLLTPTSGKVLVDGVPTDDTSRLWEVRALVGMVFAEPDSQLLAPRVDQDVAFGLEQAGIPQAEMRHRVRSALEEMGLDGFESHDPSDLSGGQKQRVAIAGALATSPRYLVMDEATAMLDPVGQSDVVKGIKRLAREGIAVIFVTHSLEHAALSDRVLILSEGRLIADGSPYDVLCSGIVPSQLSAGFPAVVALALELRSRGVVLDAMPSSAEDLVNGLESKLSRCSL